MSDTKVRHIHKTLLESFDLCPRYGYLKNYAPIGDSHKGMVMPGYDPKRAIGSCIHKGVNTLAMGASVDGGVQASLDEYDYETKDSDKTPALVREHKLIVEAGVRIWAAVQLPIIQARYKVLEAEQTIFFQLTDQLVAMVRPDIVLVDNFDGRLVNYSLKTEKQHSYIKHPEAMIDIGGTLEVAGLAAKHGGLDKVAGTWMTYVVVGDDKPDEDQEVVRWHPGVHGWASPSPSGLGPMNYAWKYEWDNPNYDARLDWHRVNNAKSKRLSKKEGWNRFNVNDYPGGMANWINDLLANKFQPTNVNAQAELIKSPEPYTRSDSQVQDLITEIIVGQTKVSQSLEAVANGEPLAAHFPKRRSSCMHVFGKRCEYWDLCWKGGLANPEAYGFEPRKSSLDRANERVIFDAQEPKQ